MYSLLWYAGSFSKALPNKGWQWPKEEEAGVDVRLALLPVLPCVSPLHTSHLRASCLHRQKAARYIPRCQKMSLCLTLKKRKRLRPARRCAVGLLLRSQTARQRSAPCVTEQRPVLQVKSPSKVKGKRAAVKQTDRRRTEAAAQPLNSALVAETGGHDSFGRLCRAHCCWLF